MKQNLSIILVVVSILLAAGLVFTKWSDNANLNTATGTIADFSNRLDVAQSQLTVAAGTILTQSNSLADATSASLTFSNQLVDAQSTNTAQAEQITSLNTQIAAATAQNQALSADLLDVTNQLTALKAQLALAQSSLTQTQQDYAQFRKDYALLQNRFQRDVAERVVLERRFNSLTELKNQMVNVYMYPPRQEITPESIYKGLDVEIKSDSVAHVIAPE